MAIFGYIRISTERQEGDNQRHRINEYAAKNGLKIDSWIEETISSRKNDRAIYGLVGRLEENDLIIVTELSRLGRSSVSEIFGILKDIQNKKAGLFVIQESIKIDGGKMSVQAETLVFALSIASRLERDLISERTKAALAARKAQGVKLGRPVGYSVLAGKETEIEKYLALGLNKTSIAKLLGVSRSTVYAYLEKKGKRKQK